MSFFTELKRRNVIRVGILYLISAWLLLQLTDVLSSMLPVPEWTGSLVIILLVIGFFPTLIFSWVFELTSEGLKRESEIDHSKSLAASAEQRTNTLITILLIIAIGAVVLDRLVPEQAPISEKPDEAQLVANDPPMESIAMAIDQASIAVLPFADLSQQQDQQYFADGIAEELLNVLVRVDGLRVASRTSSFGYRDTSLNVSTIGEELKVRHILEGSIRKEDQRIRITAQLIDASSDKHLWSESYDRELSDIFKVQDEIANAIVDALVDNLGVEQGTRLVNVVPATGNLDAYELFLRANDLFHRRVNLPLSIELFEQAIALDPDFARAWEGLAVVSGIVDEWVDSDVDHIPMAVEAAKKAIELDPSLSMPYAVLAYQDGSDWAETFRRYEQALENDSKNVTALLWRGVAYRDAGFFDKAHDDISRCLEIDPLYLICKQHLALTYVLQRDDEVALQLFEEAIRADFRSEDPALIGAYLRSGQRMTATFVAASIFPFNSQAPVSAWIAALEDPSGDQRSRLEQFDRWSADTGVDFQWIAPLLIALKAYDRLREDTWVYEAMWLPEAAEYRQSEYFQDRIRDWGILTYWQTAGFPPQCMPVGEDGFRCD